MVNLSKRSCERVWDWVEANRDQSKLADAYWRACGSIIDRGDLTPEIEILLKAMHKKKSDWYDAWKIAAKIEDMSFDLRDCIGRLILEAGTYKPRKKRT